MIKFPTNSRTYALLGLILVMQSPFAQTNPLNTINIPTSPEAAMISRFEDIPVGYYTGTANVSIPLYNLQEGKISIPLQLNYHGSGIKVSDQATWVGLGWDLSPEGSIVQEVRGKADEDDFGTQCTTAPNYSNFIQRFAFIQDNQHAFLNQWGRTTAANLCIISSISDPAPPYPWNNQYEDPYCIVDELLRGIGQPDIYTYNFGGMSGKFYIHPSTHEIILIDKKQQIYFEKTNANNIKATLLDGTIYMFGTVETASGGIINEFTGKTYKVSTITQLTGQTVQFTYVDNDYVERFYDQKAIINNFTNTPALSQSVSYLVHHKKTLSKITSTDTEILFNLTSREDINVEPNDNIQKLSSIDVKSRVTNQKIGSFEFSHHYFPYSSVGNPPYAPGGTDPFITAHADALGKRLKLISVKEIGYDDNGTPVTTKPPHTFEYDLSTTLPMKISFAKDYWGYYNGEFNQTLLPDLNYFDYFNKSEYAVTNQTLSYPYVGAKRHTDNTKAGAYLLKKVNYPTGGYSEFEYEPHSFSNHFIPDKSSPVFKSYDAIDNSIQTTSAAQFPLSKTTTLHLENIINNGKGNYNGVTPWSHNDMLGCYIKLYKFTFINGVVQTSTIKQWDLSSVLAVDFEAEGHKTWSEDIRVEFDPEPSTKYFVEVYYPNTLNNSLLSSIAGVTSHITYYDDTNVDTSKSNQCGFRVKSIKNYTDEGKLASHKLYKYYEGKLLNKFAPLKVYLANHLDNTGNNGGYVYEYIAFFKNITVTGNDFGTNGGNLIGYGMVEEFEMSQDISSNGKKLFIYYNDPNLTKQDCPSIPNLMNGLIAKEQIFDNANSLLQEKQYNYTHTIPSPKFVGVNVVQLAFGSKVPCKNVYDNTSPYTTQYYALGPYIGSQYGYNFYTINTLLSQVSGITTNQYFNGSPVSVAETYTYNSEGSVKTRTTVNSKNEQLITKYFYPWDGLINSYVDNYMINVHNTGSPVITEQFKGTELLTREKVMYGSVNYAPTLMPQYYYFQKGITEEKRATINSYDSKGNITELTQENNIPISFIWNSDQTKLLAKVENATYSSLLSLPSGLNSDIRNLLPNSRVTSYTYKPLIGISTVRDLNDKKTSYEYDGFGRLSFIRDADNNIIKRYCYNYSGQPEECQSSALPPPASCVTIGYKVHSNAGGFTALYTNATTGQTYSFLLPTGLGTLGCIPPGLYRLQITKPNNEVTFFFDLGCRGVSGTSAYIGKLFVDTSACNSLIIGFEQY